MPEHSIILLTHAAVTLYLTGLIWFVQLVHYPLFDRVDREKFIAFENDHQRRTARAVAAPMLIELSIASLLLWKSPGFWVAVGFSLVMIIWLSTLCYQIPAHNRLAKGFNLTTHRKLVQTNWIRTIAWTFRAFVALKLMVV